MGFNVSLLACPAGQKDRLLAAFGWAETDEPDEWQEAPRSCGIVGGHFIVWENWSQVEPADETMVARASVHADILALFLSETTMWSQAACYKTGAMHWQVTHVGEEDRHHIEVIPTAPDAWPAILQDVTDRSRADTEEVDHMFDAAPALFAALTGFAHDRDFDVVFRRLAESGAPGLAELSGARAAPVLQGLGKPRKSFWKFWG
jgi:hypothetical protein